MLEILLFMVLLGCGTVVRAFTPPGFHPATSGNLTVAFGNVLAVNGIDVPRSETASPPTIGTKSYLGTGSFAIMMVDPDIPSSTPNGSTSELLHWLQPGLISSNTSTFIGGQKAFPLINPFNVSAFATYIQPSPPNKIPRSHRYTQLLLNTTNISNSRTAMLMGFAAKRQNFSAMHVLSCGGLSLLMGNSFNVTAVTNSTSSMNATSSSRSTSTVTVMMTATGLPTSTGGDVRTTVAAGAGELRGGAVVVGLVAFAVAAVLL